MTSQDSSVKDWKTLQTISFKSGVLAFEIIFSITNGKSSETFMD